MGLRFTRHQPRLKFKIARMLRDCAVASAVYLIAFGGTESAAQLDVAGRSVGVPTIGKVGSGPIVGTSSIGGVVSGAPVNGSGNVPQLQGMNGTQGLPVSVLPDVPVSLGVAVQNEQARVGLSIPLGIGLGNAGSINGPAQPTRPTGTPRLPQARTSGAPPIGEQRFVPREVLIRLPTGLSAQTLEALARRHGLTRIEAHGIRSSGTTIHRWRINGTQSVSDVIRALESDVGVLGAQPNYRFTLAEQNLSGRADLEEGQYALTKLHLPQAHQLATGRSVVIAVINSGVDILHPEISGCVGAIRCAQLEGASASAWYCHSRRDHCAWEA